MAGVVEAGRRKKGDAGRKKKMSLADEGWSKRVRKKRRKRN